MTHRAARCERPCTMRRAQTAVMASFDRRARPVAPSGVRPVDGLGRRRFLTLAGLLASFGQRVGLAQPVAATFGLPEFLDLSRRLTGRAALDRQTAKTYLAAFLATSGNQARLVELLQQGSAITRVTAGARTHDPRRLVHGRVSARWPSGAGHPFGRADVAGGRHPGTRDLCRRDGILVAPTRPDPRLTWTTRPTSSLSGPGLQVRSSLPASRAPGSRS